MGAMRNSAWLAPSGGTALMIADAIEPGVRAVLFGEVSFEYVSQDMKLGIDIDDLARHADKLLCPMIKLDPRGGTR